MLFLSYLVGNNKLTYNIVPIKPILLGWEVRKVTVENQKVIWAKFSTLS
jgi:hypothetical protein